MCPEKSDSRSVGYVGSGQMAGNFRRSVNSAPFPQLLEIVMKIRTLFTGVALALAIVACDSHSTLPPSAPASPLFDETDPPPPDTTTERGGGPLGSGT
jgi:hypothetical protein